MTRTYTFALLSVICLAAACAPVPAPSSWTGTVDVSALPDDHQVVFGAALAAWRQADPRITTHIGAGGVPVTLGAVGAGHAGLTDGSGLHVLPCALDTPEGYDACYQIAAHELGHFLGVQHVDDPHAVMWKNVTGATVLTDADRSALAAVVGE